MRQFLSFGPGKNSDRPYRGGYASRTGDPAEERSAGTWRFGREEALARNPGAIEERLVAPTCVDQKRVPANQPYGAAEVLAT